MFFYFRPMASDFHCQVKYKFDVSTRASLEREARKELSTILALIPKFCDAFGATFSAEPFRIRHDKDLLGSYIIGDQITIVRVGEFSDVSQFTSAFMAFLYLHKLPKPEEEFKLVPKQQ
jgi:hypothetical protein